MASIPCKTNPMGNTKENYFSLIVKPGILGDMEYGFTPYWNTGGYCKVLDWGDGTSENAVTSGTVLSHTYSIAGTYKIKIVAECNRVIFGNQTKYASLVYDSNAQWDFLGHLTSGSAMFWRCQNAIYTMYELPRYLTSMDIMFANNENANLKFSRFPEGVTSVSQAFSNCNLAPLRFTELPRIKDFTQLFYYNRNSAVVITELPEEATVLTSTFSRCYGPNCRISPHKIPDKIERLNETFSFTESVYIDISELAANAPPEGWTNLTTISGLFYGSPNVVGSRSAFLAKCPPGIQDTNAFVGTNTTE